MVFYSLHIHFASNAARRERERAREASIQYTKLIWNDFGVVFGSLVNQQHYYLPSMDERLNGRPKSYDKQWNSHLQNSHSVCTVWPFPEIFLDSNGSQFTGRQFRFWLYLYFCSSLILYASRFHSVALDFSLCFFSPSPSTTFHCRPSVCTGIITTNQSRLCSEIPS